MKKLCLIIMLIIVTSLSAGPTSGAQISDVLYFFVTQDFQGNARLHTIDPAQPNQIQDTISLFQGNAIDGTFISPNRAWLVLLVTEFSLSTSIRLVDLNTYQITEITSPIFWEPYNELLASPPHIVWSPDSQYFTFRAVASELDDPPDVFLYSVASGAITNITNDPDGQYQIAWSPDSQKLAVLNSSGTCLTSASCTITIDIHNIALQQVEQSIGTTTVPRARTNVPSTLICDMAWSPDQAFISLDVGCDSGFFESTREMFIVNLASASIQQVTNFNINLIDGVSFVPFWVDAQTLATSFVGGKPRFGQIATYNPNTQQLTPIDNTFGWEWAANPTNTNQIAFRESIINEGWNRLDSDANSVTQVATFDGTNFQTDFEAPPGYDFHWSPNGEYIAYSTRGLSGENCPSCLRGIVFASVANGNTSEFLMPQDQNVVLPVGWLPTTVSPPTTCELGFTIASGDTTAFVSAIESANNTLDPDTICLADNGSYTLTSDLGNDTGLPLITSDITIEGNNATLTRDVAAPNFRLIQVESTGTLTLNDLTLTNGTNNLKGWRYCPPTVGPNGAGSEVWTQHEEIVGYFAANVSDLVNNPRGWITLYTYTDMQNSLIRASDVLSLQNDGTRNFNSQGRPVFDPANPNKYWFTRDEILPYFDGIDENIDDGNVLEATRDSFYNDWILVNLAGVQYGDYIYINSIVTTATNPGDTHGFVIVGWGPIQDCPSAINTTFTFATSNAGNGTDYLDTIFPNSGSAYGFNGTINVFGSIPYVVDFSGASQNLRRQSPKPRPFYCSAHNDLSTIGDSNAQGLPENYFGFGHEWFFFTMPNNISIPTERIFVSIP